MQNSSTVLSGSPAGAAVDLSPFVLLIPFIALLVLLKWGLNKRNRRDKTIELSSYALGIELLLFLFLPVSQSSDSILWAVLPITMFGGLIAFMRYWAVKDSQHKRRVMSAVSAGHMTATEVLDYGVNAELKKKTGGLKGKSKASLKLESLKGKLKMPSVKIKLPKPSRPKRVSEQEFSKPVEELSKPEPKEWPKQIAVRQPWWAKRPEQERPLPEKAKPIEPPKEKPAERLGHAERTWGLQHLKEKESEKPAAPPKTLQSNQRIAVKREIAKREAEAEGRPAKMPKWLTQLQKEEREKAKERAAKEAAPKGKKFKVPKEEGGLEAIEAPAEHKKLVPEPDHEKINSLIDEVITKRKKPEEETKES